MENIEVAYLYRDGGNHKKRGSVIFSNPNGVTPESVEVELRRAFLEDDLFIADQIRVPEVFLFVGGQFSFDDHCYHEFRWRAVNIQKRRRPIPPLNQRIPHRGHPRGEAWVAGV
jgi:hypothetical protein